MSGCKHGNLLNGMMSRRLPMGREQYFCSQCQRWIDGYYIREKAKKKRNQLLAARHWTGDVMATFFCPFCKEQREFELVAQSDKIREYKCTACYKIFERAGMGKLLATQNSNLDIWDGKYEDCLSCQNRPKIVKDYLPAICVQCRELKPTNYVAIKEQKKKRR